MEITSSIYPFRLTTTMHVSESQSPGGLLGDKGVTNGLELLRKLNRLCRHLEKNRASLLAGYLDFTSFISRAEFVTWLSDHLFERVCIEIADRLP